ncbi:MAG: FG-GAP-like repeat-containing protein [Candidatus Fermentibacter sp.]|nr:FG-GAP-like repeat-containing protein [Candidatus Fermentibacter sp.]
MQRLILLMLLMITVSVSHADSATQTDWAGGPGTPGPVTAWGDMFFECAGASWSSPSGQVDILPGEYENFIDDLYAAEHMDTADVDGDGDLDVLASDSSYLAWWENADGAGTDWAEHSITAATGGCIRAGDLDGDGDTDFVAAQDIVSWYENVDGQGASWIGTTVSAVPEQPVTPCTGDFDGDGDNDILCADMSGVYIYWWENAQGDGSSWLEHKILPGLCTSYQGVYPGDLDGDGDLDVIAVGLALHGLLWLENTDGLGGDWELDTIDMSYGSSLSVRAVDIDGDGDLDALGSGDGPDAVAWWENLDGTGSDWSKHVVADYPGDCWGLGSGDLDRDGDIDILVGTGMDGRYIWLENTDGQGTGWEEHAVCDLEEDDIAMCIIPGDVDGDGWTDILGEDLLRWWDIHVNEALLESSILYLSGDPGWGDLDWTGDSPALTDISFQVRASDDFTVMGEWSGILDEPCSLSGILPENANYFQYRAILTTEELAVSPSLHDVTVSWNPLGTEGPGMPDGFELLPFASNPVSGPMTVTIGIPEPSVVTLTVLDIAGRIAGSAGPVEFQPGYSQISLGEHPPGVYFVLMQAGEFSAARRLVILD